MGNKSKQKGFSFLEIAVVLSVIGLMMAAIMTGSYLLSAAKLNAIITDVAHVKSAVENFQIKYNGLPGDMPDADRFWGTSCVDSGDNSCNGDGDKRIEYNSTTLFEDLRAWQHLSLSGYYPGDFSGLVSNNRFALGGNAPVSEKDGVGYWIMRPLAGTSYYGQTGNLIMVGAVDETAGTMNAAGLTVQEAHTLDLKTDDGEPDEGSVFVGRGVDVGDDRCITGAAPLGEITEVNGAFEFEDLELSCVMAFWIEQDETD